MESRFFLASRSYTVKEIAEFVGAEIVGDPDKVISAIRPLEKAEDSDLSFLDNQKYLASFKESSAGACIVNMQHDEKINPNITLLKVKNPYWSYAEILPKFYQLKQTRGNFVSPTAFIAKTAKIGDNCYIGHNVVIEEGAEIGSESIIESGTYIGPDVVIGAFARIEANVSITHSIIGSHVVILPGANIGQDGFGFATHQGQHKKILHIGKVIIGNNVEIGAGTCIDRGSMNDTVIEDLCRIDNLVQIGHNVHIKQGSIIVAQVGIAGSAKIGKYCALGGQVGIAGHIEIGDLVQIAAQSGVAKTINSPGAYGGTPAIPIGEWFRQIATLKNLTKKK